MSPVMLRLGVLAVVLGLLPAGCGRSPSTGGSAEPEVVRRLRIEWESHANRHAGKSEFGRAKQALEAAFKVEAGADSGLDDLQRFIQSTPGSEPRDELAGVLQEILTFHLIATGDRKRLVELLAATRSDISSSWSIESVLTTEGPQNGITDGLMALFDAYDAATSKEAREANYLAVWCALGDAPVRTDQPDAYMRAARPWYAANRANLERCDRYSQEDVLMWKQGVEWEVPPCHLFSLESPEGR